MATATKKTPKKTPSNKAKPATKAKASASTTKAVTKTTKAKVAKAASEVAAKPAGKVASKPTAKIKAPVKSRVKASATKATKAKGASKLKRGEPERSSPAMAEVDTDVLEFIAAIDDFKRANGRPFPSWSEVLLVVRQLGYKRK